MSVGWSRRRGEKPDHPEHPVIVAGVGIDPANPGVIAYGYLPLQPVPYAPPDGEQDDDVIEPTAVFNPWLPSTDWNNVEITVEYYD
jgi:hypothetical protein